MTQHPMVRHIAAIVFIVLFFVSLIGNGCVIYIFLKVHDLFYLSSSIRILEGIGEKVQPGHVQRFCVILEVELLLHRSQLF